MDNIYKKIGKRIKELREKAGLSQREVAIKIGIKRPTISQIENGERKISAEEILEFSNLFNVTPNNMLELEEELEVVLEKKKDIGEAKPKERINVPQKNLKKFKEVLLYILNKVGSKSNVGETVIYKLLYFIDFNFYEKYEEQLIGATYIKNNYGPTPVEFAKIVEEMKNEGEIEEVESKYFNYPQRKYLPLRKSNLKILKANEKEVIDDVLNNLSDMNASQISEYSHEDVPWLSTDEGEQIEYESVFYRNPPYSVREYSED
jgi:transcriptional regulator with XRE-family HTH domain